MVWLGRVLPCRHDGLEGHALGPATAHGRIERQAEFLLGHPFRHHGQHLVEGGIGDGGGALHAGDLGLVLHLTQGLDGVGGGHQLGRVEQAGPDALRRPRHVVGFQADLRRGGEEVGDGLALVGLTADGDLDLGAGGSHLLGRLGAVPAIGGEEGATGGDDEHGGRAGEPREVAHVGQGRHQQGVETLESGPQRVEATGHGYRGQ